MPCALYSLMLRQHQHCALYLLMLQQPVLCAVYSLILWHHEHLGSENILIAKLALFDFLTGMFAAPIISIQLLNVTPFVKEQIY